MKHVLEIGPGKGILTNEILKKGIHVTAVEKDATLVPLLKDRFHKQGFELINEDILKFDIASWIKDKITPTAIVGNVPYNISTPIIKVILPWISRIEMAILTLQHEVAKRILAPINTKAYGSLSIFVRLQADVLLETFISRDCFTPVPKVDSATIRLSKPSNITDPDIINKVEHIVKHAFQMRRKKLKNALSKIFPNIPDIPFDFDLRPEAVSISEYIRLAQMLDKNYI